VLHAQVLPAINATPTNAFLAISSIRSLSTTLLRVQPLDKIVSNCAKNRISFRAMGYNARNDEIRDNVTRIRRELEAQRGALATVRRFNATLSAKGYVWFWPKIAAALTSKTSLAGHCVRQLQKRGGFGFAR
jgi:hypothetical protein